MKCIFCDKPVFGEMGMTAPKMGIAHQQCFQANEALKRTFQSLDITALSDQELTQLKDLVLAEENYRNRGDDEESIELF